MKVKLYYNLSFEFNYGVLSGRYRIKIFCGTKNTRRPHLTLEMPASRIAYAKNERENTPVK
jgi:hypothetical protein